MPMLSLCMESTNSTFDVHCYKLWCCLLTICYPHFYKAAWSLYIVQLIDQWSCNYHGKSPESTGTSYRSVTAKPCLGTQFHLTTHNLQTSLSTSHTAYLLSVLHILNLCSLDILGDSHHGTFILPEVTNVRTWGEGVYLKQLYYIT